jgi:hypothetical protein
LVDYLFRRTRMSIFLSNDHCQDIIPSMCLTRQQPSSKQRSSSDQQSTRMISMTIAEGYNHHRPKDKHRNTDNNDSKRSTNRRRRARDSRKRPTKNQKIVVDHMGDNHMGDNHMSDNHMSDNHMGDNHMSDNHMSDNHMSDNRLTIDKPLIPAILKITPGGIREQLYLLQLCLLGNYHYNTLTTVHQFTLIAGTGKTPMYYNQHTCNKMMMNAQCRSNAYSAMLENIRKKICYLKSQNDPNAYDLMNQFKWIKYLNDKNNL